MNIIDIYTPLANKNSEMMIRLAGFYEFGYHNEVKADFQKALSLYEKAASYGNTRAQDMADNMNTLGMSADFGTQKDKRAYRWLRKWDLIHDEENYRRMLEPEIEGSEINMIGVLNASDHDAEFFGITYDERGLEVHISIIMSFTYENKDYIVAYNDGTAWGFTYKKHNQVLMLSDIKTKEEYEMIQNQIDIFCHKIRRGEI